MKELFVPQELKTIEVDAEKKIFKVNGTDIGNSVFNFSISFEPLKGFDVRMEMDTRIVYATYGTNGEKNTDRTLEKHGQ